MQLAGEPVVCQPEGCITDQSGGLPVWRAGKRPALLVAPLCLGCKVCLQLWGVGLDLQGPQPGLPSVSRAGWHGKQLLYSGQRRVLRAGEAL